MTTTGFWLIDWEWSGTAPILVDLTKACSPNFGRNHSEKDRNGEATFQLASHTIGDAMGVAPKKQQIRTNMLASRSCLFVEILGNQRL
jgi:thiamine kinase-like enzyme